MIIRPREDWQSPSQPVVGPSIVLGKIELVPAHYTASSTVGSDTPAVLRAIQNDYTVNRGYSIGYNFAVDKAAEAWELRGFDFKCAANKDMNEVTVAILCLVDGADAMTPAMVDTFQALAAEAQYATGRELLVVGHRDIGSTSCPGDGIYGQVQAGLLDPDSEPTPPDPIPQPPIGRTVSMYLLGVLGPNSPQSGDNTTPTVIRVGPSTVTWEADGIATDVDKWMGLPYSEIGDPDASHLLVSRTATNGLPDSVRDPSSGYYCPTLAAAWR